MDIALAEEDVVTSLWSSYKRTVEYKLGNKMAIPPHHPLVEKQERVGLSQIYSSFVEKLKSTNNAKLELESRTIGNWLNEWKDMNSKLFHYILKDCGNWRDVEVRFGDPGDEDLYHIPKYIDVPREMNQLASYVCEKVHEVFDNNDERFLFLAKVHYQFIRIHPFKDGNGRIARAITDELSIFLGFPPAMSGYPRHDPKKRENYHRAIRTAADDASCLALADWIKGYVERQLEMLA